METTVTKPKDLDINKFIESDNQQLLKAVQTMQGFLAFGGNIYRKRMEDFVRQYQK